MIIIKLKGGLGNQMFQYAAAKALANHLNTDLKLDLSFYQEQKTTYRAYELGCFKLAPQIAPPREIRSLKRSGQWKLSNLLNRTRSESKCCYKEASLKFDPAFFELSDPTHLEGYFQCEKYFSNSRETLLDEFSFTKPPSKINQELLNQIQNTNAVALHIRRGDYVKDANANKVHGTCSMAYYQSAIEHMQEHISNPTFYIFSDEPDWAENNLPIHAPKIIVKHNPPDQGTEDLRLMINCKHSITANSSFSWWGAWLSQSPSKTVVAPKRWFASPTLRDYDITPQTWITI